MRKKTIDILIPTFNRGSDLKKNLILLTDVVLSQKLSKEINIIISDNCSNDNTKSVVKDFESKYEWIFYYRQSKNLGLEKNVVFCLEIAVSDFVMYLGDDDYLPKDYISKILDLIQNEANLSCVIPSYKNLYPNGEISVGRTEKLKKEKFEPSFYSVLCLTRFGHQLSGLVLRKKNLMKKYLKDKELRNIYPFIFFVGYTSSIGVCYYLSDYNVLVSQGNTKDWRYDQGNLLPEIVKNFKILYPSKNIKRLLLSIFFIYQHSWRLGIGKNLNKGIAVFRYLISNKNIGISLKIILPFLYPICYIKHFVLFLIAKN